jgi:galactokinase/mevalonate kinase-like predicted kinase
MFPNMITHGVFDQIELYKERVLGWKLSGAGGGGYLIFFSENPIENAIQIRIRR